MYRIAVDTGGTFTDSIAIDDLGNLSMAKAPTTPTDLPKGVLNSLRALAESVDGKSLENLMNQTNILVIGTTVATNIILELKGCKTGMITTKGFRDVLEMRRIPKTDIYNLKLPAPTYLIPRYLRKAVEERLDFRGRVITPLSEKEVRQVTRELVQKHGIEAICVFYLHSYINPEHERRTRDLIKEEFPEVNVVLSSDVAPRVIEFDRCNTAAVSAYVSRGVADLLIRLEDHLKEAGFKRKVLVASNNGGTEGVEICLTRPATLVGSGPAAMPMAALYMGQLAGVENIIGLDMGGTSTDISLIPHRQILTAPDGKIIANQKVALTMVDVDSVGVGGGGIAWLDFGNILQIGPESAGAEPGPACYGKGGKNPTITDADVVLGYIPYDYFMGGQIRLYPELAKEVIEERIAKPLGISILDASSAMHSLACTKMADSVRLFCTKRGYDPKGWTLCVGGGAGGVYALMMAKALHISTVILPKAGPVLSALGMLNTDIRHDFVRTYYQEEEPIDETRASQMYDGMIKEGLEMLAIEGIPTERQEIMRGADLRYYGQIREVEAWMPGDSRNRLDFRGLIDNFHRKHKELYGYSDPSFPTQLVNVKVAAFGRIPIKPRLSEQPLGKSSREHARKKDRDAYFKEIGGLVRTPCYDGDKLVPGNILNGPAVIEERATTIVVPNRATVEVDKYRNYIGKLIY
jgi:N-methylhydantoinase A